MPSPSRRELLAVGAGGLSLWAGCIASWGSTEEPGPPDRGEGNGDDPPNPDDERNDDEGAGGSGGNGDPPDPYEAMIEETMRSVFRVFPRTTVDGNLGDPVAVGFVVDDQHVVTNQHVVREVHRVGLHGQSGTQIAGTVVAVDEHSNLAVIRARNLPHKATALSFAAESPAIGQEVLAIRGTGDPDRSVDRVVVDDLDRSQEAASGATIDTTVLTEPSLGGGQTGGPIVRLDGRVAAVVCSDSDAEAGFGIGARLVDRVVSGLIKEGTYKHPSIGATLLDPKKKSGALVEAIVAGGPAHDAGLWASANAPADDPSDLPMAGDVIVGVQGTSVASPTALRAHLDRHATPGETVDLTITRGGNHKSIPLTLGARPADPIDPADRTYADPLLARHANGYDHAYPPVNRFAHLWAVDGGRVVDLIGNTNPAIGSQSVTIGAPGPGIAGDDAIAYDEPGYLIADGVDVDTSESFSMGAWIAHEETGDYQAAFVLQNQGEALGIGVNGGRDVNRPRPKILTVDRTNGWGSTEYGYGEWHFHVLRYDAGAGAAELWFDAEHDYEISVRNAQGWVPSLSNGELVSGFRPVASKDYPFHGRIAWPWIAPGRIDPDDIRRLYEVSAQT